MPRCRKHRCCRPLGDAWVLKPRGIPLAEVLVHWLALDEFSVRRWLAPWERRRPRRPTDGKAGWCHLAVGLRRASECMRFPPVR